MSIMLGTEVYRFPRDRAAKIAWETAGNFLEDDSVIEKVIFVCFDELNFKVYEGVARNVRPKTHNF